MTGRLVERTHELAVLGKAAQAAATGSGSIVLIFGEAGIGKSTVVAALPEVLAPAGRLLAGYCDDLSTKRTLGPFRDLAGSVGAELTAALRPGGDRDRVLAALLDELGSGHRPTVLVVEDVHWADDATVDVLRLLLRRVDRLPAVLVLTYRVDEPARDHPLRELLGQAARLPYVHRLPLRRLSRDAVRQLSEGTTADAERVFAATSGNPFLVTEALAAGSDEPAPPTVVDAVHARLRRLDPAARQVVELFSVVPNALETWLARALLADDLAAAGRAEEAGLLTAAAAQIGFRHELVRRAIVDMLPAAQLVDHNRRVLTALAREPGADPARLLHHAVEAGDVDAIVAYGPDAARDAAAAGAHREAAAHYRQVLCHHRRFPPRQRAELLEAYAIECYTLGAAQDAVDAQRTAVGLRRELGDPRALGASLRWLSRDHWWNGDRQHAEEAAAEAIAVLETAGDDRLLALALSNQSQLMSLADRGAESIAVGERAATLARTVGDAAILTHALTNIGMSLWETGDPLGQPTVIESLRVALVAGESEHALRAYTALASFLLDDFHLTRAGRYLEEAVTLADRTQQDGFLGFLRLERARLRLLRAEWDTVVDDSEFALDAQPPMRWGALLALGRARVRQGVPGGEQYLRRAWELSVELDTAGGGAAPGEPWPDERRDRRPAGRVGAHGGQSRRGRTGQAGRAHPPRGRRPGH